MTNISIDGLIAHLRYPVYVENDGTSGGYAEYFLQPEKSSMAYLSLENGVGGAVLLNGAPYFGMHHRSGEFGHMCVEPGGLACACGKNGCMNEGAIVAEMTAAEATQEKIMFFLLECLRIISSSTAIL